MSPCPLESEDNSHFKPQAEDILTDEDLLELFRVLKQMMKKKPSVEEVAKIYFCMAYAMGDDYYFYRAIHSNQLVFRDEVHTVTARVQMPSNCCSCQSSSRVLSVSYLTNNDPVTPTPSHSTLTTSTATTTNTATTAATAPSTLSSTSKEGDYCYYNQIYYNNNSHTNKNVYSIRPYTTIKPNIPPFWSPPESNIYPKPIEVMLEPKQRGFYYQDGRIEREPALLQRYAEQGVLTQASLMRKRRKQLNDPDHSYELSTLPSLAKKSKIPHRNGEFTQRRDDIINRMRTVMIADLEQKVTKLPHNYTLAIEKTPLPDETTLNNISNERAASLLTPALRILTHHSNMKPHLANGMNQNGIYYNDDYFRLYLAFVQFQNIFAHLFPNEVITAVEDFSCEPMGSSERDRERNANMKVYRAWVEPHLKETNWAAFRRNTMVGERIMQLAQVVGQGILFMTKELSGSKLHLTFTNNEWDEFIQGLGQGRWDDTIDWSHSEEDGVRLEKTDGSLLVTDLRRKLATHLWFTEEGTLVALQERKAMRAKERLNQKEINME